MYTACLFIATQIRQELSFLKSKAFLNDGSLKMFLTGGGALNNSLVQLIDSNLALDNIETIVPNRNLIEYKELLLMGLLAYKRINLEKNTFAKYTGAMKDSISACIYEG